MPDQLLYDSLPHVIYLDRQNTIADTLIPLFSYFYCCILKATYFMQSSIIPKLYIEAKNVHVEAVEQLTAAKGFAAAAAEAKIAMIGQFANTAAYPLAQVY